jgi:serine/threonine protein kinase
MQFCDGGDLSGQIKTAARNRKLFAESKILHWFVQMALGLHYMHAQRVLHRDLKTQNIFLTGNGRLVLGDLGISKVLEGTMDFAQTCIGTPYYMSPARRPRPPSRPRGQNARRARRRSSRTSRTRTSPTSGPSAACSTR